MTTRKELLIEKYAQLETELKKHLKDELFPSLDSIDAADLSYLITMIFLGITTDKEFDMKLKELIDTNKVEITDEAYQAVFPLIKEFILWFRTL